MNARSRTACRARSLLFLLVVFEAVEVGMSSDEYEWVRLPGLFRWDEVCDVFAVEAVPDHEWRFLVQVALPSATRSEPLYVVHATNKPAHRTLRRNRGAQRDAPEMPARDPSR